MDRLTNSSTLRYPKFLKTKPTMERFLLKALYGLKQSLRFWYESLSKFVFDKLGFKCINADHSIFVTPKDLNGSL